MIRVDGQVACACRDLRRRVRGSGQQGRFRWTSELVMQYDGAMAMPVPSEDIAISIIATNGR
jgi:hypothetical protein